MWFRLQPSAIMNSSLIIWIVKFKLFHLTGAAVMSEEAPKSRVELGVGGVAVDVSSSFI